ncbi:MAG: hypothetical protein JNJ83_11145 [Verrucomicrobiaceae bacterium]|nr:hypothetical protein [Verrucomicrobiaceae bacterium]
MKTLFVFLYFVICCGLKSQELAWRAIALADGKQIRDARPLKVDELRLYYEQGSEGAEVFTRSVLLADLSEAEKLRLKPLFERAKLGQKHWQTITGKLTLKSGKVYEGVTGASIDGDALKFFHKMGAARVPLNDVPDDVVKALKK